MKTGLRCPKGKASPVSFPYTAEKFQFRALWSALCDSLKCFHYQQGTGSELGVASKHELFTRVWKLPFEIHSLIFGKKKANIICSIWSISRLYVRDSFVMVFIVLYICFHESDFPPWQHGPLPSNSILEYIEFSHEVDLFMTEKEVQSVRLESGARGPVQLWPLEDVWGLKSDRVTKRPLSPHLFPPPWPLSYHSPPVYIPLSFKET